MYKIYMLEHPQSKYPPYIGYTKKLLFRRIKEHFGEAEYQLRQGKRLYQKNIMLLDCINKRVKIKVHLLLTGIKLKTEVLKIEGDFTKEIGLEFLSNEIHGGYPNFLVKRAEQKKINEFKKILGLPYKKRKVYTLEHTEKISKALKGRKRVFTLEHKKNISKASLARKRKPHSALTHRKIGLASKGRFSAMKGRKYSDKEKDIIMKKRIQTGVKNDFLWRIAKLIRDT